MHIFLIVKVHSNVRRFKGRKSAGETIKDKYSGGSMDKSSVIGLVICMLLFLIFLNWNIYYSSLDSAYCCANLQSTYYSLIP
jgi:hypothetical protein